MVMRNGGGSGWLLGGGVGRVEEMVMSGSGIGNICVLVVTVILRLENVEKHNEKEELWS